MSEHHRKLELSPSVAIIIAGLIIAGAIIFTNHQAAPVVAANNNGAPSPTVDASNIRKPSASEHIIGSANAPIVLIEYSDYQCPFCQMIYPTIKKIVDESNGQIAWVYRQYPLTSIHPQAAPAANAAECITAQLGNTGFWKYTDTIFNNQAQLSAAYSAQVAQQMGVNMTQYSQCLSNGTYQKNIDADSKEVQSIGGSGTPYVVVLNTKTNKAAVIPGALPYDQAMAVIKSVQ